MRLGIVLLSLLAITAANAQQQVDPSRIAAVVPALVQQRNAALDSLALCTGDLSAAQAALKSKSEELEKSKSEQKSDK